MAEARCREAWNHTSAMMALTANCHRDPKKNKPFKPQQFHPYQERRRQQATHKPKVGVELLKQVFLNDG
jgi:hypothetical protein